MDKQINDALKAAYDLVEPILAELMAVTNGQATALMIRGFNPKSVNSPKRDLDLNFWAKYSLPFYERDTIERLDLKLQDLVYPHIDMLRNIWRVLVALCPDTDRIQFTPKGGSFYRPFVSCANININKPDATLFMD